MFPAAHVGHWIWVLYLPPILIVAGSLVRSKLSERKDARAEMPDSSDRSRESR